MNRFSYNKIKHAYLVLYMTILTFWNFIPFLRAVDEISSDLYSVCYAVLSLLGAALVLFDLWKRGDALKTQGIVLLLLFLAAAFGSSVYNFKYGFAGNVKTLLWSFLQFFLLMAQDAGKSWEEQKKEFRLLTEWVSFLWTVAAVWSVGMFFVNYSETVVLEGGAKVLREGNHDGRLFGIFVDPNFASIACLGVIVFVIVNQWLSPRKKGLTCWHVFVIAMQVLYVVLAYSRTAFFAAGVAIAVGVGYRSYAWLSCKNAAHIKRTGASVAAVILSLLVLVASINTVHTLCVYTGNAVISGIHGETAPGESDIEETLPLLPEDRTDVGTGNITNNRTSIWADYFRVFLDTPIFGTSPRGALDYATEHFQDLFIIERQYSVHNSYLQILVTTGIIGTVFAVLWLVKIVIALCGFFLRQYRMEEERAKLAFWLTILLIVFAVGAFPMMYLFFSNVILDFIFWTSMGCVLCLIRQTEPERHSRPNLLEKLRNKCLGNP